MARDTKVGMLLGLGIILLVGIFVSDALRPAVEPPAEAATGFAGSAMDRGRADPLAGRSLPSPPVSTEAGFVPLPPAPAPTPPRSRFGDGVAEATTAFAAPLPAWRAVVPEADLASATREPEPLLVPRADGRTPPAEPALGAAGGERSLRVRTGDTLAQLSLELYRSTGFAEALAAANPHAIDTTGRLVPGATLIVPDHSGLVPEHVGRITAAEPVAVVAEALVLPPPAAELRAPAPVEAAPRTIEVRSGDSLSRLAARHLGDADRYLELYEANRGTLDSPDDLVAGMELLLPAGAAAVVSAPAAAPSTAVAGVGTYTVRPGDSLSRIAGRVLGDADRWEELYAANRDLLETPDRVVVGQQLRVPG